MWCLTLLQVSYLQKVLSRYLLQYIGELHRQSHWPSTICGFMMLYYLQCIIRILRPSFCSPSGRVSHCCPRGTSGKIWLDLQKHSIRDCFCSFQSHVREDHTAPYRDLPVWWDPQSEIPELLHEKGLILWPNIGVCGQEYGREDWQITETCQSSIISILTYGTYNWIWKWESPVSLWL